MPDPIHKILQIRIGWVIDILEDDGGPVWLDVPKAFRPALIRVYKQWQHEAGAEYGTKRIRKEVIRTRNNARATKEHTRSQYVPEERLHEPEPDAVDVPAGCEKEEAFYMQTGIMVMKWLGHENLYETEVKEAYEKFDPDKPEELAMDFLDVVDENWKTNPTFIDLDWQRNREASHADVSSVAHDPFEFGVQLSRVGFNSPDKQGGLLNICAFWFSSVANAFRDIRLRIKVEACVGDVTTVFEQIRYGSIGHRTPARPNETPEEDTGKGAESDRQDEGNGIGAEPSQKELDRRAQPSALKEYPKRYHRIHLSNVPDYIGGSLSTFLYAVPLLEPGNASYVTANCLRNPPRFKSHDHFNNEYIALSSPKDLKRLFHVRMDPFDQPDDILIMTEYAKWHHVLVSTQFADLMPRATLETWLYRLFLKLAVPVKRTMRDFTLIYSPLNLTVFLRLCGHLHNIGYPAHWLNTVLDALLSGSVATKARPPRSDPLSIQEAKSNNTSLVQSTKPFVAELATLASLWQFALPFGLVSQHVPPVQKIHKYSMRFPQISDLITEPPAFILVLFDMSLMPREAEQGLRPIILSDEDRNMSDKARIAREEGTHIITTWQYDRAEQTATFWFRSDVFESLVKAEVWGISIWRTDAWVRQAGPEPLEQVHDLGQYIQ